MNVQIVRVGNSRGIRIPKGILAACRLEGEVSLAIENDALVIRRARRPRQGWAEAFREAATRGDDTLLLGEPASTWDPTDWEW